MSSYSYGDLASTLNRVRLVEQTKVNLDKFSLEVASGLKSNISREVSGNFTPLASMERSLRSLESYQRGIGDAELFTSSMQTVLQHVSDQVDATAAPLLGATSATNTQTLQIASETARAALDSAMSALNTRVGGRALFSGLATQETPLASADTLIAEVKSTLVGLTTADDIKVAVDAYFAIGTGDFEMSIYQGSNQPMHGFLLNEHERANVEVTAADAEIRDVLKGLVLGSLVSEGELGGDVQEQANLLKIAGEQMYSAGVGVDHLRATIGAEQAKIEAASTRNTAERVATEQAISEIVSADIYASAAKLSEAEGQLELMYTITARLSRLKLSDYL
ncbi:flagellin [Celeribacter sp.]|uniref:flagellin n=1 Tax=Celeribacter sp. TaxID=1890673 RepID=UPI003A920611